MAASRSPQKPRRSWVYFINPTSTVIRCKACKWIDSYDHTPDEQECTREGCDCLNNVSKVFRGYHPVVVLTPECVFKKYKSLPTALVVPLTSQETFAGLPTSYPIQPSGTNKLSESGYALCHNPLTVDLNAFKTRKGGRAVWIQRTGKLTRDEMFEIDQRLSLISGIDQEKMARSWLEDNPDPGLCLEIFKNLTRAEQHAVLEDAMEIVYPQGGS